MNGKLLDLLARERVPYDLISHPRAYTAQERAAACHISGHALAKVVVVHDPDDDWHALAVLPAAARLDVFALREVTGRPRLRLADERALARLFPDCEVGAVPPFGRLLGGLEVYLDGALTAQEMLVCDAGRHGEDLRLPMRDYLRIERPEVLPLAVKPAA